MPSDSLSDTERAVADLTAELERVREERDALRARLRELFDALDRGAVQMASAEIDIGDPDMPPFPWHEEWLHHARAALGEPR